MLRPHFFPYLCVTAVLLLGHAAGHGDIVGLGGFIQESAALQAASGQSHVDLSVVKVELYTLAGVRKDTAECAPNGYYFMAIYETGTFIVKAKGLPGWSVEPTEIRVECAGEQCAKGKDVNFEVTGFSVVGQIGTSSSEACQGGSPRLQSISVSLFSKDSSRSLSTVKPLSDGSYKFSAILPGDYLVKASHPFWDLVGPEAGVEVHVPLGPVTVPTAFRVVGYPLTGMVVWEEKPVDGVEILLYSGTPVAMKCPVELPSEPPESEAFGFLLCYNTTAADGRFHFVSLPCGSYTLVARYHTQLAQFEVAPGSLSVVMGHGAQQLGAAFQVTGFAVGGQVLHPATQAGVAAAKIFLNGKEAAVTDENGFYVLSQMQAGSYLLEAAKDGMKFTKMAEVQVEPTTKQLPSLQVVEYSICGSIILDGPHFSPQQRLSVSKSGEAKPTMTISSDKSGEFCVYMPPGDYLLSVDVSQGDASKGLILGPASAKVELVDAPVDGVQFAQHRVSLKAPIVKLNSQIDWGDLSITLSGGGAGTQKLMMDAKDGESGTLEAISEMELQASFMELIPAEYLLKVSHPAWCWKKDEVSVLLDDQDKAAEPFLQSGFIAKISLSHPGALDISGPGIQLRQEYAAGVHPLCLPSLEPYTIRPTGCYYFGNDVFTLNPADSSALTLQATHFFATGSIKMTSQKESPKEAITIKVTSQSTEKTEVVEAKNADGTLKYTVKGTLGDTLVLTPAAHPELLFFPSQQKLKHVGKNCQADVPFFEAQKGAFAKGHTDPAVAGVNVTLTAADGKVIGTAETEKSGSFSFGPLHHDQKYSILMVKEGYEFVQQSEKGSMEFIFSAKKLAKVEVIIEVNESDQEGVLVVLTGGSYRSNVKTDKNGRAAFWNLSPTSYYVTPFLKEYQFDPNRREVVVHDGKDASLTFRGKRTAFSIYGKLKTLNDKPVSNAVVEALGPDDLYESSTSGADGSYRLRGLKPGVKYIARVAQVDAVDRGWPEGREVLVRNKDIQGVDFMVLLRPSGYRITGVLVTSPDHINQTVVEITQLASDGTVMSKPVPALPVDTSRFFEARGLVAGQYVVKPISRLPNYVCNSSEVEVTLGQGPSEVYAGEVTLSCQSQTAHSESGSVSPWPILVALIVIASAYWRTSIQGFITKTFTPVAPGA